MEQPYYKKIFESSPLGIFLSFHTTPGGYHPAHWHEEMELLYPLNGEADITIENKTYQLPKKNVMAIECCKVHSTFAHDDSSMYLRIHISKEHLQNYIPEIANCQIQCIPELISQEQFPEYYKICSLLAELTRLYMYDALAFRLEAEGLILQVLARLLRFFSSKDIPSPFSSDPLSVERIRSVIRYVEEHFQENISLQDAASFLGVSREHFCRIFKKNTGTSFLHYLDEVRLSKIYSDLQATSLPVAEIMEKNGFTNQKRFHQSFKKMYGCTPSSIRKPPG
ncbi:hypothetical protein C806_03109 [Lachnospiraceae bacterium 3-1]|nr:hypothetical protein C806_03109 [Lachnospiraceae bacterium 3-1]